MLTRSSVVLAVPSIRPIGADPPNASQCIPRLGIRVACDLALLGVGNIDGDRLAPADQDNAHGKRAEAAVAGRYGDRADSLPGLRATERHRSPLRAIPIRERDRRPPRAAVAVVVQEAERHGIGRRRIVGGYGDNNGPRVGHRHPDFVGPAPDQPPSAKGTVATSTRRSGSPRRRRAPASPQPAARRRRAARGRRRPARLRRRRGSCPPA